MGAKVTIKPGFLTPVPGLPVLVHGVTLPLRRPKTGVWDSTIILGDIQFALCEPDFPAHDRAGDIGR